MQTQSLSDRFGKAGYLMGGLLVGAMAGVAAYKRIRLDLLGDVRLSRFQDRVFCLASTIACAGIGGYLVGNCGLRHPTHQLSSRGSMLDVKQSGVSEATFGATRVTLINGDLTKQGVDAIVNAANSTMLGGGGIDGAIHTACGPGLRTECLKHVLGAEGRCLTGEARLTATGADASHIVPFRWVVHVVGPKGEMQNRQELLASAYRRALEEAATKADIKTIGFCSISTGIFGYPIDEAAFVAIGAIKKYLESHPGRFTEVRFCFLGNTEHRIWYEKALTEAS